MKMDPVQGNEYKESRCTKKWMCSEVDEAYTERSWEGGSGVRPLLATLTLRLHILCTTLKCDGRSRVETRAFQVELGTELRVLECATRMPLGRHFDTFAEPRSLSRCPSFPLLSFSHFLLRLFYSIFLSLRRFLYSFVSARKVFSKKPTQRYICDT